MSHTRRDSFSSEAEMYTLWRKIALPSFQFECRDGQRAMVVSPGRRNDCAGPDFLEAVILIDGGLRVGPVEMHRSEREWFHHGHHRDRQYDPVILHVVHTESERTEHRTGLPTYVLSPVVSQEGCPVRPDLPEGGSAPGEEVSRVLSQLSWERFLNRTSRYLDARQECLSAGSLLVPIFDALGYSANRAPMRRTAERILRDGIGSTSKQIIEQVVGSAGLPPEKGAALARRFGLVASRQGEEYDEDWNFSLRVANRPEARLVAAAVLVDRLFRADGIQTLRTLISTRRSPHVILRVLTVRANHFSFLGTDRAGAILVNVLLPAFLADGIQRSDSGEIAGACLTYRHFPSLAGNRTLREFSRRFAHGKSIRGAFLQQGAHEFMARTT